MHKQFLPFRDNSLNELQYVENVWSEKWQSKGHDEDLSYLENNEYFRVLKSILKVGDKILEGGFGKGQWVRFLTDKGFQITGVDLSRSAVEDFKRIFPHLDVTTGDIFNLNFPDSSFDAYLSFGVIEHFENGPDLALSEARRVLKKNGYFCVSVPFLNTEKRALYGETSDNKSEYSNEENLRFYQYVMTKPEFKTLLERAGFKVEKIYLMDCNHRLKAKSKLVTDLAEKTKNTSGLLKLMRPGMRKIWHLYTGLRSKERFAHMMFAICKNVK